MGLVKQQPKTKEREAASTGDTLLVGHSIIDVSMHGSQ
jgi:hypothetical protein